LAPIFSRQIGANTLAVRPGHASPFKGDQTVSASFVIDTQNTTQGLDVDAFDLTGTGDTLLVTSAGSLLALDGGNGITASGSGEMILLNGLAYSAFATGVELGSANTLLMTGQAEGYYGIQAVSSDSIVIDGTALGEDAGVFMNGSSDSLIVNGQVQGTTAGISFGGASASAVNIGAQGSVGSAGAGVLMDIEAQNDVVTNDGHITGAQQGVYVYGCNGNSIVNDGTISSSGRNTDDAGVVLNAANLTTVQNIQFGNHRRRFSRQRRIAGRGLERRDDSGRAVGQ
jgi:hypothetical protein